ncbi:hypothetical protein IMF27_17220 [Pseudomonas sp. PCH199]|uniref:hypothetical protein n=1 Tax=unclassified Pseudomonas TaxID=196821 RepID=UPI000BD816BE|nr:MULTISPECIES: hypothetical protein [unclassified Pseudomonas]MCW8277190.1 hypothetical protein [Pseudomonas sp. PCH199]PAM82672.1 hypothetical protein CES87_17560 [Pseudomonas sp. ERMR1:02]
MALKQTINFRGIYVADAYIKTSGVTISLGNERIDFVAFYMASSTDAPFNNGSIQCAYNLNGDNPIKQGYEYLRTLSEFADAIDC